MPTLRDIIGKIDIVDVISSYIELKRVGNNYVARCPFHPDDTPSFYVSPSKGIFKCFGCGVGGDAVKFVSLYEGLDYWEAIESLAKRYNLPIKLERKEKDNELLLALERVADFYHQELKKNQHVINYLRDRGLSSKTISKFFLGFAGNTDGLLKMLRKEGLIQAYERSGNLTKVEDGIYRDLFRNRIVIPIKDVSGRVVAFGGRSLDGSNPKYVNSPESQVFKKRSTLFGLQEAKEYIKEADEVVLVEGYFDLMSLWQEGIRNCVAPLGTAFTEEHAITLSRFTKRVLLLYDGDNAGRKAVRSSVPYLLKAGLSVRVVYLPEGEDPDSFVRKDPKALRDLMDKAQDIQEELLQKVKEGNKEAFENLLYFCSFITDGVKRFEILKELSKETGLSISSLQDKLLKVEPKTKEEHYQLSYHEAVLLAGLYKFGFEGVDVDNLKLSLHALKLLEALRRGEYHLIPNYIKNMKLMDLKSSFEESLKVLSLPQLEESWDFHSLRQKIKEQPRKLRIRR